VTYPLPPKHVRSLPGKIHMVDEDDGVEG
jgi:hypothetical protein